VAIGAAALALLLWLAYGFVFHPPATKAAATPRYSCPMHPSVVSDHAGDCPICGMSLVAEAAVAAPSSAGAPPQVQLSATQQVLANVATAKAEIREFAGDVQAVGKVAWDERGLTRVSARVGGRVERLRVTLAGTRVEAGQPLLDLYSPDWAAAQREFLLALECVEKAPEGSDSRIMLEGLRDAARARLKLWGVGDAEVAGLQQSRQPKTTLAVLAPVAGVITERQVTAGQYVNEGAPLFALASLGSVWVEAEVYENDMPLIAMGSQAGVTSDAYPGQRFAGRVVFLEPALNPETRTFKVRVSFSDPAARLKPDMFVRVAFAGRQWSALAVPESAVVVTGDRAVVWVETAPGTFELRPILAGRRGNGVYEVRSGLSDGETVAVSGAFLIDAESQLKTAPVSGGAH
jgi:Cu(I)/Ag(I) efflux system membrane fusion protein